MSTLPVLLDRDFQKKATAIFTLFLMLFSALQSPEVTQTPTTNQLILVIGLCLSVVFLSFGDLFRLFSFRQNFNSRFQTTVGLLALIFVFGFCFASQSATDYWHYLSGILPITWFAWFYFRMLFVYFDFV